MRIAARVKVLWPAADVFLEPIMAENAAHTSEPDDFVRASEQDLVRPINSGAVGVAGAARTAHREGSIAVALASEPRPAAHTCRRTDGAGRREKVWPVFR